MAEVYNDEEFKEVKEMMYRKRVRGNLERVFNIYNSKRELLLDDVVNKMISSGSSAEPKAPGFANKSENLMLNKLAAEEFVKFIDGLMRELDQCSYDIIDLVYCDGTIKNVDIYEDILDMSHRDFYRKKWRAEHEIYRKLSKNNTFLKSWHNS